MSILRPRRYLLRAQPPVARVRRLNEELRLLDQAVRLLGIVRLMALFVRREVILRELPAHERVEEQLGVVKGLLESRGNTVGSGIVRDPPPATQCPRRVQIGRA